MRLSRARRLLSREHKPHRDEDGLPRCVQCVWAREELPAEDGGQRGRRGASEVGDAGGEVAGASWAAAFPLGKVGRCEQVLRRSGWCLEHPPDCPVRERYRTGASEGKPPRLSALVQVDARLDSQPGPRPRGGSRRRAPVTFSVCCCRMGRFSSSLSSPLWAYSLADATAGVRQARNTAVTTREHPSGARGGQDPGRGRHPRASQEGRVRTHSEAPAWTGWAAPR